MFVSAGNLQSTTKKATITFRKKDTAETITMEAKDFKPIARKPVAANPEAGIIRPPVFASTTGTSILNNSHSDIMAKII